MQSVLVAVAASNGGHHPKVTRSMFSHPAMGGRHWRRPLQNITVQADIFSRQVAKAAKVKHEYFCSDFPRLFTTYARCRSMSEEDRASVGGSPGEAEFFITPV